MQAGSLDGSFCFRRQNHPRFQLRLQPALRLHRLCHLPLPENWLPFAVPAGEKKWVEGD
jgi:uncharacterized protein (DUF1684 family)